MFDNYLIRSDSLRNEERNGELVGFSLAVRNANYRGVFLSLHNGYFLEVDGVDYPTDLQTFAINGQPPRSFDELRTAVWEHWDYDDEGILHVRAPGGLAPGVHTVRFQQSVLAAYGYLPTDEEWVRTPPRPGTGAGSDKTPQIVTYTLSLSGQQAAPDPTRTASSNSSPARLTWDEIAVPQLPEQSSSSSAGERTATGIRLGVSLYSYQQARFFKELDLEAQIREVGEQLQGADGIEVVDEMSFRYPDPGVAFLRQWFGWMERYGTVPVTMDVSMDVLQFRDHVMSIDECAARLRHDIRLAKTLGFRNVRVLSTTPLDVMLGALPLAEQLDIKLGKEIHQPMPLEGRQVSEIIEFVERSGTTHLGIVPDFGIFQIRPSEALLQWFERRGAQPEACAAVVELAALLQRGEAPFSFIDLSAHTAGNLRSAFHRFLATGECQPEFASAFTGVKRFADERLAHAATLDYTVVGEALMLSHTSPDALRQIAGHVISVHGKFYHMSPVPERPGQFQDIAFDYAAGITALRQGGFNGYINSEYEGQRYWQDRWRAEMMDEVEQVRRHQEMLRRLTLP
jgi:hypothetical protein